MPSSIAAMIPAMTFSIFSSTLRSCSLALRAALPIEAVHFLGKGAHGFLDGARGNQPVFQTG